jgi:ribosomal protein S18 acetylase RimI-like enzyme
MALLRTDYYSVHRMIIYAFLLMMVSIPVDGTALQYQVLRGHEARPYLKTVAELTINILQEYPYLYQPEGGAENEDVDCYYHSPDTIMVGAFDDKRLVAIVIGLPLEQFEDKPCGFYATQALRHIVQAGENYFYVSLLLVEKEYRHQRVAQHLMCLLEDAVKMSNSYTYLCALVLERYQQDHPDALTYDGYYERCYQHYFSENRWCKHEPLVAYMINSTPGMRFWSVPV